MCAQILPVDKYYDVDQQIARLRRRKLIIPSGSEEKARNILNENSYTPFIKFYGTPFLVEPDDDKSKFLPGTTIDEIYAVYTFNSKIRALYLEYILIAEHALKTVIADRVASKYGPTGYWNKESYSQSATTGKMSTTTYFNELIQSLKTKIYKKYENNDCRKTPFDRYRTNPEKIPIWLLVNILELGTIRRLYNCLKPEDKTAISNHFGLTPTSMETTLYMLNFFRNACAHDERIYDFYFQRRLKIKANGQERIYDGVYAITIILKKLLKSEHFLQFYTRLNEYFDDVEPALAILSLEKIKNAMRFPIEKEIALAEMGSFNDGVIFTREEFTHALNMYIIPLTPMVTLDEDIPTEKILFEKKHNYLVQYDQLSKRLYFSPSNNAKFMICSKPTDSISTDKLLVIEKHLRALISSLQIVWNSKKAAALTGRERRLLFKTNIEVAYQLSVCSILCSDSASVIAPEKRISLHEQKETLYCVLSCMDQWSARTYEGKHVPFGVVVNNRVSKVQSFDYIEFLEKNYCATISDGHYSYVEINANGKYHKHLAGLKENQGLYTIPYPYQGFAKACSDGSVGILLTFEGDILIISEQTLFCTKHNGHWTYNMHNEAIQLIEKQMCAVPGCQRKKAAQLIYQTLVDVSHSHGGACIAISDTNPPPAALLRMTYPTLLSQNERQLVKEESTKGNVTPLSKEEEDTDVPRMTVLRKMTGSAKNFLNINIYLRRELIEMDGALILGPDGLIHAVASIVNTNGASVLSGARETAAKRLSQYGLAIKVSQDGYMKFYKNGEAILMV